MKWEHKGHQFDEVGEYFKGTKTIYLYGVTPGIQPFLEQIEFAIEKANQGTIDVELVFVDRNECKRKDPFLGKEVISPETFYQRFSAEKNDIVVLCVSEKSCVELWKDMHEHKIKRHLQAYTTFDFFRYLSLFIYYRYHKCFLHLVDMFLHTGCNLNCRGCIVQTYQGVRKRRSAQQIKKNLDDMFRHIDFVGIMNFGISEGFLGGHELEEVLKYVSARYADRFLEIGITTNGTILPPQSLIDVLKEVKASVTVDDYRENVALARENYPKVIEILQKNNIRYSELKRVYWDQLDFNGGNELIETNEEVLSKKLGDCISMKGFIYIGYHEQPNRIFSCCQQAINTYLNIVDEVDDDGLDLETASTIEVIEFLMGYTEKGYLSACTRCNGAFEGVEMTHIPVAVQIEEEDHGC